jgi:hypothetical protein
MAFDSHSHFLHQRLLNLIPAGVSDCVDLQLWAPARNMYYDHCCYVRFQKEGVMHAGCVGLSEEHYLQNQFFNDLEIILIDDFSNDIYFFKNKIFIYIFNFFRIYFF